MRIQRRWHILLTLGTTVIRSRERTLSPRIAETSIARTAAHTFAARQSCCSEAVLTLPAMGSAGSSRGVMRSTHHVLPKLSESDFLSAAAAAAVAHLPREPSDF
jgi:hypothetical protein